MFASFYEKNKIYYFFPVNVLELKPWAVVN